MPTYIEGFGPQRVSGFKGTFNLIVANIFGAFEAITFLLYTDRVKKSLYLIDLTQMIWRLCLLYAQMSEQTFFLSTWPCHTQHDK